MKNIFRHTLSTAAAVLLLGADHVQAEALKLRLSVESTPGSAAQHMLASFRDALKAEMGDAVEIEFFDSGTLGDEIVHVQQVRTGQLDVIPIGSDAVQLDTKWAVLDIPFLFADHEAVAKVLDGKTGVQLDAAFRKSAGLKVLGFGEIGFRNISNNVRPIVKPEDLDGVKLRVSGSKTRILAFEMLGAAPINMNIGEVYLALQQDEFAEIEDGEGDDSDDEAAPPLGGLHAKVFVQENGWDTAITIGSGNATRPALLAGRNVEVFATLTGKRSRVGSISDIFGPDGFGRVLRAFRPAEIPQRDAGQRAAEQRIERARRELVNAGLALICTARKDEEGGQRLWKVILQPGQSTPLDGLGSATCWPITLGEAHAHDVLMALRDGDSIEIGTMPLIDVTRFVAFRLTDATHEETTALFALGLRISGLPTTRHRAILRWVLDSREAFLRYLRLLLADTSDPLSAQFAAGSAGGGGRWHASADDEPILEDMVRALSHGHDRLSAVRRLMERLERISADDGPAVVPEDFARSWDAFSAILDEGDRTHA